MTEPPKIRVDNPSNLPLIDYNQLVPLQGDLKELPEQNYHKLLSLLLAEGFFMPVVVWLKDTPITKGKKVVGTETVPYLLDGHQRRIVLVGEAAVMVHSDGSENSLIPYFSVHAETEKQAKQRLLAITSQFGQITEGGFRGFTSSLDIAFLEFVNFDAIDVSDLTVPVVSFDPQDDEGLDPDSSPLHSASVQPSQRNVPTREKKYDGRGNELSDEVKDKGPLLFPISVMLQKPEQNKWKAYKEKIGTVSDNAAFIELLSLAEI